MQCKVKWSSTQVPRREQECRIDASIAVKLNIHNKECGLFTPKIWSIHTKKYGVGPLCHITSKSQLKGDKALLQDLES